MKQKNRHRWRFCQIFGLSFFSLRAYRFSTAIGLE